MRKENIVSRQTEGVLIPAYGKKKLLGYAESFYDLAKTFTYRGATEGEEEMQDRQTWLLRRRLMEDREILADNLKEVARIIRLLAEESFPALKEAVREQAPEVQKPVSEILDGIDTDQVKREELKIVMMCD